MHPTPPVQVQVRAPARLHMGFLDLHGGLGRRFGSVGLTLDPVATVLTARRADTVRVEGAAPARTVTVASDMLAYLGNPGGLHVQVESAIPEHVGLGSGTQLALALGMAASRLYGIPWDTAAVAHHLDRGARSGIGVGAFDHGGFLLDGGRGERQAPPPVVAALPFPEHWRVLLVMEHGESGLHGHDEVEAFRTLPRFPEATAAHLCRVTLMQLLPAIREADLAGVAGAIWELQTRVGDHFAPAQGGRFTSPAVATVLEEAAAEGLPAGQSSWGPTGFVVLPDEATAQTRRSALADAHPELDFRVCRGRNCGAEVHDRQQQKLASS